MEKRGKKEERGPQKEKKMEEEVTFWSGLLKDAGCLMACSKKRYNIPSKPLVIHLGRLTANEKLVSRKIYIL